MWSTWGTIFGGITTFLVSTAAMSFWLVVGKHVLCWFEQYFCWVLTLAMSYALPVLLPIVKIVPALPAFATDPVLRAWLVFNYYFPVNEVLLLAFLVFIVIASMRLIRFIKQYIPTVAN